MKENSAMKIFKYKFSTTTKVFIYLGLALAAAAFGLTLYNVISGSYNNYSNIIYPIISYAAMFFVSILLFIILISLLISSYYAVGDKKFKTSFGLIKSTFLTDKVQSVALDRETNKLTVHFNDDTFIVIVVKSEWYEEFINELIKCNPAIEYTIISKTNSPDDQLKK